MFDIGEIVGANNALLIKRIIPKNEEGNNKCLYEVECQLCKKDPELFGDAIYKRTRDYIHAGKLPCGCSRGSKWTKYQWEVVIKRKCKENNSEFIGFVDVSKIGQNSKLKLKCNVCGNEWDTCSANNLIKNRTCPECANLRRARSRLTNDEDWIKRFRESGFFPEDTYSFKRHNEFSRSWYVYCKKCGEDNSFTADRSNLVAGKVPCNCSNGGGFDVSKSGYFYILLCKSNPKNFIKYGITNFPQRRLVDHKRTLKSTNGIIDYHVVFNGEGSEVLALESHIKRTIKPINKSESCFKEETCELYEIGNLLKQCFTLGLQQID